MITCGQCRSEVNERAKTCPYCGLTLPESEIPEARGYEYRSQWTVAGLPLIHISFKYIRNRGPVVAKGVIAIGQFAVGIVTFSQFGIGVFSLGQFVLAGFTVAQIAIAHSLVAQFGLYLKSGTGQFVYSITELIQYLFV